MTAQPLRMSVENLSNGVSIMNAQYDEKHGTLTITVKCNPKPIPSATGKTLVVASSHGNQATTAVVNGQPLVVGFNAYIKAGA